MEWRWCSTAARVVCSRSLSASMVMAAKGPKAAKAAAKTGYWTVEIVERLSTAVGFEVLPKRWIVKRTFAWLSRFRRLARDFERYARTVAAFIHLAMLRIMLKLLVASCSS